MCLLRCLYLINLLTIHSMLNEGFYSVLWQLIWKNPILRKRIVFSVCSFPLFIFVAVFVVQYLDFQIRATYILIFLSGLFYHFFVTIFSISAVYSYSKFLIYNRILFKIFIGIYFLGLLTSIMNCAILIGVDFVGNLQFEVEQIYISFLMSNFIFAPLGFWVSSFDFVKMDLFGSSFEGQPRPMYLAVIIVFLLMFSLLLDARAEFGWSSNLFFLILFVLILIVGAFLRFIFKCIYINYQNSIAE